MGLWRRREPEFQVPKGYTVLVGLDPVKRDVFIRYQRAGDDGSLRWPRGQEVGEVIVGDGTAWTHDGQGRVFFVNRKTLHTYNADETHLRIMPDDGWSLGNRALGIHERNLAEGGPKHWLDELVKYTPLLVLALTIISVIGFAALGASNFAG